MDPLHQQQFDTWLETAEVIERDDYGIKVMRLSDGSFLKLFRRKTLLSKHTLFPQAKRFAENARNLEILEIPCPKVLGLYQMRKPYRSVVHYLPLPGETLRQVIEVASPPEQIEIMSQLGHFVARLHELGVYFRSLHMRNIIKTPDGELGLIDFSDMRCFGRPLSKWLRQRSLRHLDRYPEDWDLVDPAAQASFTASLQK